LVEGDAAQRARRSGPVEHPREILGRVTVREVPVVVHAAAPSPASSVASPLVARLAAELRGRRTLGEVLSWCRDQLPPRGVTQVVTQDEYTHDVIVGWNDRTWLVFDTT
jgi:hypothetical protein